MKYVLTGQRGRIRATLAHNYESAIAFLEPWRPSQGDGRASRTSRTDRTTNCDGRRVAGWSIVTLALNELSDGYPATPCTRMRRMSEYISRYVRPIDVNGEHAGHRSPIRPETTARYWIPLSYFWRATTRRDVRWRCTAVRLAVTRCGRRYHMACMGVRPAQAEVSKTRRGVIGSSPSVAMSCITVSTEPDLASAASTFNCSFNT